ncbi:MAG: DUF559 domain-containing protein [Ignavibacteriae bacterium]|nr:MAG: DUF559 domain-containing protein [Ignavibacteriota bacterium]
MNKDHYNNYYNKYLREYAKENRRNSTFAEFLLWNEILKGRKLGYQFHRQRSILGYIGDFFCKELMLFIETDGATHEWEETKLKDKKKETELIAKGYTLLRFKDTDVAADIDATRKTIEVWIEEYEKKHPQVLNNKYRSKRKFPAYLKKSSP